MRFEFDPAKSASNKEKHGISFDEAKKIWDGLVVRFSSKNKAEERELAIGRIDGIFWSAIITLRGGVIRLISCRRSRKDEKEKYEEASNHR